MRFAPYVGINGGEDYMAEQKRGDRDQKRQSGQSEFSQGSSQEDFGDVDTTPSGGPHTQSEESKPQSSGRGSGQTGGRRNSRDRNR